MTRRIFTSLLAGLGQLVSPVSRPPSPPWVNRPQSRCPLKHRGAVEYGHLVVAVPDRPAEGRVLRDGDSPMVVANQIVYRCATCGVLFTMGGS